MTSFVAFLLVPLTCVVSYYQVIQKVISKFTSELLCVCHITGNNATRIVARQQRERIRVNWNTLTDLIDVEHGLLLVMYDKECLTRRQKERIQGEALSFRKNELLLEIMTRKSSTTFNKFLDCLKETQQSHVVTLLTKNSGKLLDSKGSCFVSNIRQYYTSLQTVLI